MRGGRGEGWAGLGLGQGGRARQGLEGAGSFGPFFAPPSCPLSAPVIQYLEPLPTPCRSPLLLPFPHPLAWGQARAGFMGLAPVERIRG